MDISLELKGLPCLNKVYLLTYLLCSVARRKHFAHNPEMVISDVLNG